MWNAAQCWAGLDDTKHVGATRQLLNVVLEFPIFLNFWRT